MLSKPTTAKEMNERMQKAFAKDRETHKRIEGEIRGFYLEYFGTKEKVESELEDIKVFFGKGIEDLSPSLLEIELQRAKEIAENDNYLFYIQDRFFFRLLDAYLEKEKKK